MTDQQSSPVPDPHSQNSTSESSSHEGSGPAFPSDTGDVAALSDQEAFLMLAMSMSDDASDPDPSRMPPSDLNPHGWSVEFTDNGQTVGDDADVRGDRDELRPELSSGVPEADHGDVSPLPVSPGQPDTDAANRHDFPSGLDAADGLGAAEGLDAPGSVIDLRAQSPFLAAMAGKLRSRRSGQGWSPAAVSGDQWEVYEGSNDDGAIHGRVTELVDLSKVPPPLVDHSAGNGSETVVPFDPPAADRHPDEPVAESNPASSLAPPEGVRLVPPPPDQTMPDSDLPPLVFLNTQGDIMPSIRDDAPADNQPPAVLVEWGEEGLVTKEEQGCGRTANDFDVARDDGAALEAVEDSIIEQPTVGEVDEILEVDEEVIGNHIAPEAIDGDAVEEGWGPVVNVPMSVWQAPDTAHTLDEAGRLFDQYCGPVVAVIASVAKDRRAIDEAIQETFLTAWESMDSFDPDEPRGPWMFTLARRTAFEQVTARRQMTLEANEYPEPSHRELEVPIDLSWEAWEVRLAVDQLSAAEYDVLRLIHREGLIHPEVASEMNSTVGAVKSRAYSGSHSLIELLDHVIRPDAEADLTEDQAAALTWYLAGVADGSDLDHEIRSAVKRVRDQMASPTAWIAPDPEARDRLLEVVRDAVEVAATPAEDALTSADSTPVPLQESTPAPDPVQIPLPEDAGVITPAAPPGPIALNQAEPPPFEVPSPQPPVPPLAAETKTRGMAASRETGNTNSDSEPTRRQQAVAEVDDDTRPPIMSILVGGGLVLIAIMVMTNLFGLLDADSALARKYQLQPTEVDADATAVVHLAPTDIGTQFEFEFGGLDPSSDDDFYSAWLQRTVDGAVAPLGSFQWDFSGSKVLLSGPMGHDDYDLIVITKSSRTAEASATDPVVLAAAID